MLGACAAQVVLGSVRESASAVSIDVDLGVVVWAASLLACVVGTVMFWLWPATQTTRRDVAIGVALGAGMATVFAGVWAIHRVL